MITTLYTTQKGAVLAQEMNQNSALTHFLVRLILLQLLLHVYQHREL